MAALVGGCATAAVSSAPSSGATGSATVDATSSPTPAGTSPASGGRTFPPSQTAIEPGTYRWDGFEHPVSVALGSGWALGHDTPAFFDLFRGSDFPSVSFARFTDVYLDGTHRTAAVDAATVASTLARRSDMTLTDPATIELGGLGGRQFDLATSKPQTPLFLGPAGDFRLDPEFKSHHRVLDFPGGGVLVIGIHAHTDDFDDAVALGDPVVATLNLEP
jgi:hypothetical protein